MEHKALQDFCPFAMEFQCHRLQGLNMQIEPSEFSRVVGPMHRMEGAVILVHRMEGPVILLHRMEGPVILLHRMEGAVILLHRMEGAVILLHRMEGAVILLLWMEGAVILLHRMEGAVILLHRMEGAVILVHRLLPVDSLENSVCLVTEQNTISGSHQVHTHRAMRGGGFKIGSKAPPPDQDEIHGK